MEAGSSNNRDQGDEGAAVPIERTERWLSRFGHFAVYSLLGAGAESIRSPALLHRKRPARLSSKCSPAILADPPTIAGAAHAANPDSSGYKEDYSK